MPFFKGAKRKSFLVGPGGILTGLPPLTQRQERRIKPSTGMVARTIDSWDFTTTLRSPMTSVVEHGKGGSGGHGHKRSSTGSRHSPRTSPTTSVSGRSWATSVSGQSPTAITRRGWAADGEEENDRQDEGHVMHRQNAVLSADTSKVNMVPSNTARRQSEASAPETSSTSSSPPSTDGCGESSPPSSVCGSAPKPTITNARDAEGALTKASNSAMTAFAEPATTQPTPGPTKSSPSIWRKLTRGAGAKEKPADTGGDKSVGNIISRKASVGRDVLAKK